MKSCDESSCLVTVSKIVRVASSTPRLPYKQTEVGQVFLSPWRGGHLQLFQCICTVQILGQLAINPCFLAMCLVWD